MWRGAPTPSKTMRVKTPSDSEGGLSCEVMSKAQHMLHLILLLMPSNHLPVQYSHSSAAPPVTGAVQRPPGRRHETGCGTPRHPGKSQADSAAHPTLAARCHLIGYRHCLQRDPAALGARQPLHAAALHPWRCTPRRAGPPGLQWMQPDLSGPRGQPTKHACFLLPTDFLQQLHLLPAPLHHCPQHLHCRQAASPLRRHEHPGQLLQ
mmetsp:Transcript_15172/g.27006  ORF Transcript_15172/g.27006 Transcript_15172/m.27006 type:complete len:207 (-) Transcript_15172:815-1435(-)